MLEDLAALGRRIRAPLPSYEKLVSRSSASVSAAAAVEMSCVSPDVWSKASSAGRTVVVASRLRWAPWPVLVRSSRSWMSIPAVA